MEVNQTEADQMKSDQPEYRLSEDLVEDQFSGAETPVNTAFSNTTFVEVPKVLKPRRTSLKPQDAKLKQRAAKQAAQSLVQWLYVAPHQLRPGSDQPRQAFEPAALDELAESIQSRGILQPILVRPLAASAGAEAVYEIIAGERRWRASQQAGLAQVPVLVQHMDNAAAREVTLIENVQREDLTPLETASALTQMTELGYSVRKLATKLNKQKGWVEQHLLLTRLPADLRAMVSGRPDSGTHARELEQVTDPDLRAKLIALVRDQNMSLAELRRCIQEGDAPPTATVRRKKKARDEEAQDKKEAQDESCTKNEGAAKTGSTQDVTPSQDAPAFVNTPEAIAVVSNAPQNSDAPQTPEETTLPEAEWVTPETNCLETDGASKTDGASADMAMRQEMLKARLRKLSCELDKLDRPADPAVRAEMTRLLHDMQVALTATLERWAL